MLKKLILKQFIVIAIFFLAVNQSSACTVVVASNAKQTLVGNNEDYTPGTKTFIWARPAIDNKFGYVFWGFKEKFPEGGMNDKGLFYDVTALPEKIPLQKDPTKQSWLGYIVEKILQDCSTVDEAAALINKYNLVWYEKAQVIVADRSGKSLVFNASYQIRPEQPIFVATNYNLNDPAKANFQCWRRKTAYQILKTNDINTDTMAEVLEQTAQRDNDNGTLYSQICDLKNGYFFLYQKANFGQRVKVDLKEILAKGKKDYEISSFFYDESASEPTDFVLLEQAYQLNDSNKTNEAIRFLAKYENRVKQEPDLLAAMASLYLKAGNTSEAKAWFKKLNKLDERHPTLLRFGENKGMVTFKINGLQGADKIALAGSFNDYKTDINLFQKTKDGWTLTMQLPKGEYAYKLFVDDTYWLQDPGNQMHTKPKQYWDSWLKVW